MKEIFSVRTFTDKEGNEKKHYSKVGILFENEKSISIFLEMVPLPSYDKKRKQFQIELVAFEPKTKEPDGNLPF